MTWNYRVMRHVDIENRESYRIHDVYYDGEKIMTVSEEPAIAFGESSKDLEENIRLMLEAFEKPILEYSDF